MGKFSAILESSGIDVDTSVYKSLDVSGQAVYDRARTDFGSNTYRATNPGESEATQLGHLKDTIDPVIPNRENLLAHIVNDQRSPSGIIGEDPVRKVTEFQSKHLQKFGKSIGEGKGRNEYKAGIARVFKDIDTSKMTQHQQAYFAEYKRFYRDQGGVLYPEGAKQTASQRLVSNVISNAVTASPNVIVGNIVEGVVKVPALYGKELPAALPNWLANPWKLHEDRAAMGLYDIAFPDELPQGIGGKITNALGKLNDLTDVPLKNLAWEVGLVRDGEAGALKAVEDVAFKSRLGNVPRGKWSVAGRGENRLISYSISAIKLHAGLLAKVIAKDSTAAERIGALTSLSVMYGMVGAIGGPAAVLPKPLEDLIVTVNPDAKESIEQYKTPFANLLQLSGVGRLGVGYGLLEQKTKAIGNSGKKAIEAYENGDLIGTLVHGSMAGLSFAPLSQSPLGNAQIQKAFDMGRDIVTEDMDEEIPEDALHRFFPFTK